MDETKNNEGMCLNLALSYGSRDEITRAVKNLAIDVKNGLINPEDITESMISDRLFTAGIPDPDLMIRTSGEMRISNFLMWQLSYAEIFFTPTLWPDFNEAEYKKILKDYQLRDRRFGKVEE
jgi:undecaprenyl diphosphate synthase